MSRSTAFAASIVVVGLALAGAAPAPAAIDAPDLWVKWFSVAPGPFHAGDSFTIKLIVENKGHAPAPGAARRGYVVHISLADTPAGFPAAPHAEPAPYRYVPGMRLKGGAITTTVDLRPGAHQEYSTKLLLPQDIKPGTYWLGITVDPLDRVSEPQPHPDGEHNNVTNTEIKIDPR